MNPNTWWVIYWLAAAVVTGYILNKQNKRISLDGVIGNTPAFNGLVAAVGGGIFLPIYLSVKFIKWVYKFC